MLGSSGERFCKFLTQSRNFTDKSCTSLDMETTRAILESAIAGGQAVVTALLDLLLCSDEWKEAYSVGSLRER
jgi:hypothetical protein